jgi:maltose/moltooligosaccharide transporter
MKNVLHNDRVLAIQVGGGLFILAAIACLLLVKDQKAIDEATEMKIEIDEKRSI